MRHTQSTEDVLDVLATKSSGLSAEEASLRRERHGFNVLEEKKRRSPFTMLLDQFRDFLILGCLPQRFCQGRSATGKILSPLSSLSA